MQFTQRLAYIPVRQPSLLSAPSHVLSNVSHDDEQGGAHLLTNPLPTVFAFHRSLDNRVTRYPSIKFRDNK